MTIIDSDNRHAKVTREQLGYFKTLADSLDGWQFSSEQDNVKLYTKEVPNSPLPIVRGDTVLANAKCSPMDIATAAILPGCRKIWDEPFDASDIREMFTRYESLFWCKMKAPWPVSPRDISGTSIRDFSENVVYMAMTSVEDKLNPPDPKCVRANLTVSGWKIYKTGADIAVTYVTQIDLAGYIPYWLLRSIQTSVPLCAGKLVKYVQDYGFPPNTRECTGKFVGESLDNEKVVYTVEVEGGSTETLVSRQMFPTLQVHVSGQSDAPTISEASEGWLVAVKGIRGQAKVRLTL